MARDGGGTAAPTDFHFVATLGGNSSSAGTGFALISSGTMTIAGGSNITLSQNGNAVTIVGGAGGGGGGSFSAGVSNLGNSAGDTGVVSNRVVMAGGNNVTLSQSTNSAGATVTVSGADQTAQTQNLHNLTLTGNTAGAMAQVSSGTLTLAGGNNITLSQAGNAVTISGPNSHAQQTGISGVQASNTTYTSGSVVFTGSNAATVRSTTGQAVVIDVPTGASATGNLGSLVFSNATVSSGGVTITGSNAATVKSGAGPTVVIDVPTGASATGNLGAIAGSNATYNSGTVTLTGVGGGVTVSSNTGQRIDISVAAQTAQTQNLHNVTLSGNTAGAMAQISSGTLTLAGGANITLSQAGNAVTISGAAGGGAGFSAGASNLGNTAGATGVTGTRLVLVGTNNITLSQTTDANGGTISISGGAGGGGGFSAGVSNVGNSSGNTGLTGSNIVLSGGNNVTLSQSTHANGATIGISGPALWSVPSFSYWENAAGLPSGTATAALTSGNPVHRQFYVFPLHAMNDCFPGNMTVSTMYLGFSGSQAATTSTLAYTYSIYGGIYTMNGSSLSLLNSFSTALSTDGNNASISSLLQGHRWISLHSSQWSAAPSLSQTNYWMGIAFSTAGESKGLSSMVWRGPTLGSAIRSGIMGVGTTTGNSSKLNAPWHGIYTATTASPPVSITKGQVAIPGNTLSAGAVPHIIFDNMGVLG